MSWTYSSGVLTSAGATESSPDSLLAGIAIVQAADATKGYRSGYVAWLTDVEIRCGGSAIIFDDDIMVSFRGSTWVRYVNGSGTSDVSVLILGRRSRVLLQTTVERWSNVGMPAGSSIITRRSQPQDPAASIYYLNAQRHDFPTLTYNSVMNKVDVDGLDLYGMVIPSGPGNKNFLSLSFGNTTNFIKAKNVRFFGLGLTGLYYKTTYADMYLESLDMNTYYAISSVLFSAPTFYKSTPVALGGDIRQGSFTLLNPTFLNACWNGTLSVNEPTNDTRLYLVYAFTNFFKSGSTAVSGVNARFMRARQSVNGAPTWTAPNSAYTAVSDSLGTYTSVNLLDAYCEGASTSNLERFNWSLKARKYNKKTAAENVFTNRVLYQQSVNMSAGYSEEVQMLDVSFLTLAETQALALTGITLTPSGATGGTVTLTSIRSVAELWQFYRAWIPQIANFGSDDTWTYDGVTLNTGNWTLVGAEFLTGKITTPLATAGGAMANLTVNGDVNQATPTNLLNVIITGILSYLTNTNSTITISNVLINVIRNIGTGVVTINKVNSTITNYTDAEINFIDSTISVIGADTVSFHPTATDRDLNINASGSFSGSSAFKFGSTINGSVMSGTLYLRCVAGGIPFSINKSIVLGDNLVDLGTTAQLASLSAKIDLTAKEASLNIVNQGVQKASKFKRHNTNI
jgi:hypothetical protein